MKSIAVTLLSAAAVLAGCASGALPARDFPPGARVPSATELTALLRGKTFDAPSPNGVVVRSQYAADANTVQVSFSGRTDSGTWRAEDGRACYDFKTLAATCSDYRLVGQDVYMKRANGVVVRLTPVR